MHRTQLIRKHNIKICQLSYILRFDFVVFIFRSNAFYIKASYISVGSWKAIMLLPWVYGENNFLFFFALMLPLHILDSFFCNFYRLSLFFQCNFHDLLLSPRILFFKSFFLPSRISTCHFFWNILFFFFLLGSVISSLLY